MNTQVFFRECRDILDIQYDRRERIIKLSRDITSQSKKMIFALHRVAQAKSYKDNTKKFSETEDRKKDIIILFKKLAEDIQGRDYYRYSRSFSGGIEEFIEALAFYHFLQTDEIITKPEVEGHFINEEGKAWLHITAEDYMCGLADLTGELMRYAIHLVSSGKYDKALHICRTLRKLDQDFDLIASTYLPQLNKKLNTLKQSIKKVEQACYTFQIRGSEYPADMYMTIIKNHQEQYEQEQGNY
ncbi:Translin [Mycotypha africana]|uniref:Translin n=1 Tax=Mycotypha africana TaxID=64632 RepID=UPI002300B59D|nr:Translin [Mycotypha africana]KAI8969249.1 Translin [Mycotypha africana]